MPTSFEVAEKSWKIILSEVSLAPPNCPRCRAGTFQGTVKAPNHPWDHQLGINQANGTLPLDIPKVLTFYLKTAPKRGKFQQIDTVEAVKPGCINVVS